MKQNEIALELVDPLLHIHGRGTFISHLQKFADQASDNHPLSLLLIDVDKFKQVNDLLA